jgi:hypothetical protein
MVRFIAALAAFPLILLAAAAPAQNAPAPAVGQIDAAVAPVALYPDALLTPLLMAATYPNEIAEAAGWLGEAHNAGLKGDALVAALEPRPWDPSVKTLVPFPVTLGMLAARPDWTATLGQAFIASPAAVMAEIQKLRRRAIATGKLASSPRLMVRDEGGIVAIVPADPAVVNIPVYNPALMFGAWPYPNYPPVFIEPPHGFDASGADMETGIGFSVGFGVLAPLWGWAHPDWTGGTVAIDTAAYNRINRYGPHAAASIWRHEPHPTGYFHIAQDQVTPPTPPAKHGHERAAANVKAGAKHPAHAARHAVARAPRKSAHAHARAPAHRGKVRVAADRRREHRQR